VRLIRYGPAAASGGFGRPDIAREDSPVPMLTEGRRQPGRHRDIPDASTLRTGHLAVPIRTPNTQLPFGEIDVRLFERDPSRRTVTPPLLPTAQLDTFPHRSLWRHRQVARIRRNHETSLTLRDGQQPY